MKTFFLRFYDLIIFCDANFFLLFLKFRKFFLTLKLFQLSFWFRKSPQAQISPTLFQLWKFSPTSNLFNYFTNLENFLQLQIFSKLFQFRKFLRNQMFSNTSANFVFYFNNSENFLGLQIYTTFRLRKFSPTPNFLCYFFNLELFL